MNGELEEDLLYGGEQEEAWEASSHGGSEHDEPLLESVPPAAEAGGLDIGGEV